EQVVQTTTERLLECGDRGDPGVRVSQCVHGITLKRNPVDEIGTSPHPPELSSESGTVRPHTRPGRHPMRKFSVRPTLTLKGRTFKGPRGWSGKPSHPPLTDVPIGAYLLVAGFDVVSAIAGDSHGWAGDLWRTGTWILAAGLAVSVLAALTGLADARSSSEAGTQARRTINTHATFMVTATLVALADLVWRLAVHDTALVTPVGIVVLSV